MSYMRRMRECFEVAQKELIMSDAELISEFKLSKKHLKEYRKTQVSQLIEACKALTEAGET